MTNSRLRAIAAYMLALSGTLSVVLGCGRTINRTAERKIRDALPGYIGPARVWRAHVENPPERTMRGRLSVVTIDGEGVDLKQTVTLDTLHIEMHDTEVDSGRQQLKKVGSTTFLAVVTEQGLNEYLRRNPPPDEEPIRITHVQLRNGKLYAEGTRSVLGKDLPFTSLVEPQLVSPTRLFFDPDRMSFLGLPVPLPQVVLKWLSRRLSQGFDFSTMPFPLQITRFRVEAGRLYIEGSADVMKSLNEKIGRVWKDEKSVDANFASSISYCCD